MSWQAYVPPWYPDLGPLHNPFAMNGETGPAAQTIYADWVDELERKRAPGALERLVAEHNAKAGD